MEYGSIKTSSRCKLLWTSCHFALGISRDPWAGAVLNQLLAFGQPGKSQIVSWIYWIYTYKHIYTHIYIYTHAYAYAPLAQTRQCHHSVELKAHILSLSRFEVWLREGSRDGKRTLDRKNMQLCCMARLRLSIAACLVRMQHLAIAPYRIVSKLISKTSWMIPSLNPSHTRYTGISWVLLFIYEVKSSTILLSSCPCLFGTRALSHISRKLIACTRQLSEGSISLARSWCTSHSWLSR